jgi:hypothetical protein
MKWIVQAVGRRFGRSSIWSSRIVGLRKRSGDVGYQSIGARPFCRNKHHAHGKAKSVAVNSKTPTKSARHWQQLDQQGPMGYLRLSITTLALSPM